MITAFEIQVLNEGDWKIDSIFDDEELATFEANRVFGRGLYDTVRVVQEIYNEITDTASARTIAEMTKTAAVDPEQLRANVSEEPRAATGPIHGMRTTTGINPESGESPTDNGVMWWLGLVARSVGIAIGGLAILFLLRLLYEFL